jgi:hypothetical protein
MSLSSEGLRIKRTQKLCFKSYPEDEIRYKDWLRISGMHLVFVGMYLAVVMLLKERRVVFSVFN